MKAVLPGAIEDLNYCNGMLAAVGGDQLKLFSIDAQFIGLRQTAVYNLREHFDVSPHKLIAPLLELQEKRIHSVNFTTQNSLIVSFVDTSPLGQHSIL